MQYAFDSVVCIMKVFSHCGLYYESTLSFSKIKSYLGNVTLFQKCLSKIKKYPK